MSGPAIDARTSWADLLEYTLTAVRDVRTLEMELVARSALLTELVDELVRRVAELYAIDVAGERDPITPELLGELTYSPIARALSELAKSE